MTEPNWLSVARTLIGVREVPGKASNPTIMGWMKKLGSKVLGMNYTDDSIPWCGAFMAYVMKEAGFNPPSVPVRAASWDKFGVGVKKPYMGSIARFQREGGGHVGIITGQDKDFYRVLGGNQSDMVCETWIAKDRCVSLRWPSGIDLPFLLAPMAKRGTISTNEA